jgi:DNA-binding MarR family transcriptional regulator
VEKKGEGGAPVETAGVDLLAHCNNAVLRKAARRLGTLYDDVLEPSGLKTTQYVLLAQIHDLGTPTMASLANSLVMDLSATRHSLGPLIRDRFVRVRVDAKDRRVRRVSLTPTGVAKLQETMALWRQAQDRLERALGEERAAKLRAELSFLASDEFKDAF